MNSAKLNDWIQVIGIFALVSSLIFVGLQIKQTSEIALSQVSLTRASSAAETIMTFASNEHAMSAIGKGFAGQDDSITEAEALAGYYSVIAILYLWENTYYQYQLGFIPEDQWRIVRERVKTIMKENSFARSAIRRRSTRMRPSMREMLDEIDAELRKELGE